MEKKIIYVLVCISLALALAVFAWVDDRRSQQMIPEYIYYDNVLIDIAPVSDLSCGKDSEPSRMVRDLNPQRFYYDFPELILGYEPLNLIAGSNGVWTALKKEKSDYAPAEQQKSIVLSPQPGRKKIASWQCEVPREKMIKPIDRLWNQEYEEPAVRPVAEGKNIFYKNFFRLFCRDADTGQMLWSFSLDTPNRYEERLFSFKNLDIPEPNTLLKVSNERVYADLNNSLCCIDFKDNVPTLVWQVPLGQYYLASSPELINQDAVFVSLIDRRGQLWGVLFNAQDGRLLWDTFLCLTTVVCPSSEFVAFNNGIIYFLSNRGLVAALDSQSGRPLWLFAYEKKKWFVHDMWKKPGYAPDSKEKDFIKTPYAAACLVPAGKKIVVRPRDSNYVYVNDAMTGKMLWRHELKGKEIIGVQDNEMYLKAKSGNIFSINLDTQNKKIIQRIERGEFKGRVQTNKGADYFKNDSQLYAFDHRQKKFINIMDTDSLAGWLQGQTTEDIFCLVSGQNIQCYNLKNTGLGAQAHIQEQAVNKDASEQKDQDIYRFGETHKAEISPQQEQALYPQIKKERIVIAEGEGLRTVLLEQDTDFFPYFFILKNDQLLCCRKKDGEIIWSKQIIGYRTNEYARICLNFNLRLRRYGNSIVLFDGINLCSIQPDSGRLNWIFSNDSEDPEMILNYQKKLFIRKKTFLFDTFFGDSFIAHFRQGKLHFIRPESGECYACVECGFELISGMDLDKGTLACLDLLQSRVLFYDCSTGKLLQNIDISGHVSVDAGRVKSIDPGTRLLKSIDILQNEAFSSWFKMPYYYVVDKGVLMCIDLQGAITTQQLPGLAEQQWFVCCVEDRVVLYSPFEQIIGYTPKLDKQLFSLRLKQANDGLGNDNVVSLPTRGYGRTRESEFIHLHEKKLIYFNKQKDMFFVNAFDPLSGQSIWQVPISDKYTHVWHCSNSIVQNNIVSFVLTLRNYKHEGNSDLEYVQPIFMSIDLSSGAIIKKIKYAAVPLNTQISHYVSGTNASVFVNENNQRLIMERF